MGVQAISSEQNTEILNGNPLVIGEVLFDELPGGKRILGGAPFNVAWNLNGFGRDPIFVSAVGDDEIGQQIRDRMAENSFSTAGLATSELPTGVVQVSFVEGEPSYQIVPDRAYDHLNFDADLASKIDVSLIYHGSLAWRTESNRDAILRYRSEFPGAPVFVDLNIREPWFDFSWLDELIGGIAWLKVSVEELRQLCPSGQPITDSDHAEKKLAIASNCHELIHRFSLKQVLVTDGSEGAYWISASKGIFQPAVPVDEVVDTIGAGDAFSSACIHSLLNGLSPEAVLKNGTKFAARVCRLPGATTEDDDFYAH